MNRSYSKLRHIQESNILLERRESLKHKPLNENELSDQDLGIKIMNVYCKAPYELKSRMGKGTAVGNLFRGGSGPGENFLEKVKKSLDDSLNNQSVPDSKLYNQVASKFKDNNEVVNFVSAVGVNKPYPNNPCSAVFPMGMKKM